MEQSDGTLILEQVEQICRGTQVCVRHEGDSNEFERGQKTATDESEGGFGRSPEAAAAAPRSEDPTGILQVALAGRVGGGRGSAQGAGCERISGGEVGALRGLLRRVRAAQHPQGTIHKYC